MKFMCFFTGLQITFNLLWLLDYGQPAMSHLALQRKTTVDQFKL